MTLPPFLLDEWIAQKQDSTLRIDFDLGSSTGPVWTLRELLSLGGDLEDLLDAPISYVSSKGSKPLREGIAALEGCDPDHVLVTTGGAEALLLLFSSAAGPGANVVLPMPGFPANDAMAQAFDLEIRRYVLRQENGFRIDIGEIESLVDGNTKLVLVNSPHNPTGALLSDSEMEALDERCAARGVQLVSDQVYHPIYYAGGMRSAARLPHATALGDFSKALCLSGLRLGWLVERDPVRRERYLNARRFFTVSSASISERLGALALRQHEAIYSRARRIAGENLNRLDAFFANRRGLFDYTRPSGGMTAFPRMADGSDARPFCVHALQNGILIVPGDCFGMAQHFRIGFAASGDRFGAAIDRLEEVTERWREARATAAVG